MNKFGLLSILMALGSVVTFYGLRGPNADLTLMIIIFGSFSLLGLVLAALSQKLIATILGVTSNGLVLVFTFFLLLGSGAGG